MQPAGVLRDGPAPRDRKGQKQRVQTGIVKSFPDVLPRSQKNPCLIARNGCEALRHGLPLLLAHPRAQHDDVADTGAKPLLERVEVVVPLGENQW